MGHCFSDRDSRVRQLAGAVILAVAAAWVPFQASAQEPEAPLFTGLTEEQLVVVARYCEGRLANEDLLAFVPEFSQLEQDYCRRACEALLQFGYQLFDGSRTPEVLVSGSISESYQLCIADQLVVTFRGQV